MFWAGISLVGLILENARVLTLDRQRSTGCYVAVQGERITAVGYRHQPDGAPTAGVRRIDCQGMVLVPGFNDAHLHLLAFASSLKQVDCRPGKASSITAICDAVGQRAAQTPPGQYIRAFGYDEYYLSEKRHPNRWDLDAATHSHPVRLDHRTGHASVLNSAALARLGIGRDTPDPVDGVIERQEATGEPTGLLFEMSRHLRPLSGQSVAEDMHEAVRLADGYLLSRGITSVQDATPTNDPDRWHLLKALKEDGCLTPRVCMMPGVHHLDSFAQEGLTPGDGDHALALGGAKLVLSLTTGSIQPNLEDLGRWVRQVHRDGHQLAIHAVEQEVVQAAANALLQAQREWPRPDARHRIEHCCECPVGLARMLAEGRSVVVTQPAFTYLYGDKYLGETQPQDHGNLYPLKRLHAAGVPLASGSDAPVASPDPLLGMYSARYRHTLGGQRFNASQALDPYHALRMQTLGGAYASFQEEHKGTIEVGKLADLVLLSGDPTDPSLEEAQQVEVMMTMVGGRVVWEG